MVKVSGEAITQSTGLWKPNSALQKLYSKMDLTDCNDLLILHVNDLLFGSFTPTRAFIWITCWIHQKKNFHFNRDIRFCDQKKTAKGRILFVTHFALLKYENLIV